jgi:hypothetical protein
MGKKIQEAMDAERPKFLKGAAENGVDEAKALEVWNLLDKFANYGFNKSHAAAYAVVSYQTAWLKANHPVEFMAGVMNCDIHLTDKLAVYFEEVDRMGSAGMCRPCVNRSGATFDRRGRALVYALGALKNVGVEAMRLIVAAREAQGGKPFRDAVRFRPPGGPQAVGKRPLEMLARAGAFDALDRNRRRVFDSLDALVAYSAAIHEQKRASARRCRCSARRARTCPSRACRRPRTGCPPSGCARSSGRGLLPLGPPAGRLHASVARSSARLITGIARERSSSHAAGPMKPQGAAREPAAPMARFTGQDAAARTCPQTSLALIRGIDFNPAATTASRKASEHRITGSSRPSSHQRLTSGRASLRTATLKLFLTAVRSGVPANLEPLTILVSLSAALIAFARSRMFSPYQRPG